MARQGELSLGVTGADNGARSTGTTVTLSDASIIDAAALHSLRSSTVGRQNGDRCRNYR